MESVIIISFLPQDEQISLESLFGNETKDLSKACRKVMVNWLYPYADCYISKRPTLSEFLKNTTTDDRKSKIAEYRALVEQWYLEHPEEREKEEESHKNWEMRRNKQFSIIYGIAKRHHLFVKWNGNGNPRCGDQWEIYRKKKRIGRICCF
ncbi:MAG: hypothetical protein HFJ50_04535 [Clostridia bacterium]|jgi:ABC-type transporter MlaC component|nr:hypothetical protein [Clostridia bacterium]